LRQVGRKQFVYTVKVCELITHIKRFTGTKELVKDFGLIADLLSKHMGCFLFQLPPSFSLHPCQIESDCQSARSRAAKWGGISPCEMVE